VLRARGLRVTSQRFAHGAIHALPGGLVLGNSYHVSRYNTNTGRLTPEMFVSALRGLLAAIG
jgi:uracil-DNA glycosylase